MGAVALDWALATVAVAGGATTGSDDDGDGNCEETDAAVSIASALAATTDDSGGVDIMTDFPCIEVTTFASATGAASAGSAPTSSSGLFFSATETVFFEAYVSSLLEAS